MMTNEIALGLLIGFVLDLMIGWPNRLYQRIGHPVGWQARPIRAFEKRFNRGGPKRRFILGSLVSLAAIAAAASLWGVLGQMVQSLPFAAFWIGLLF